jgi:hypothetical protein
VFASAGSIGDRGAQNDVRDAEKGCVA